MWFLHRQIRELLVAAGGPYKPGYRLKHYWYDLCEDLAIYTDTTVQPRTLEEAWQKGILSKRVRSALEELVEKKRKQKVSEYDKGFIADLKMSLEWTEKNDPLFPRHELFVLRAVVSFLDRIAVARSQVDAELDRISCCKARLELTKAILQTPTDEAAE